MKGIQRIFSGLLALCMVVTMLPVSALAEELTDIDSTVVEETVSSEEVVVTTETVTEPTEETSVPTEAVMESVVETAIPTQATEPAEAATAPTEESDNLFGEVITESVPAAGSVQTYALSGECGENVYWSLNNGVLTISGAGDAWNAPWYEYKDQVTHLVVTAGVFLGTRYRYPELISADIGMANIQDFMFEGCTKLSSVTLRDTVISIGERAFSGCESLQEIVIPDSVVQIGYRAFDYCTNLKSVHLSNGITELAEELFYCCDKLTDVNIPSGVTVIKNGAFYMCSSLENVDLPDGLVSIGDYAFDYSNLNQIDFPDGLVSIGSYAFRCCSALESIHIPASVESIGEWAFGHRSHYGTIRTKSFYVDSGNQHYSSDASGVLFDKNKTVLISAPALLEGEYVAPSSVRVIKAGAFEYCDYLTGVVLPDAITTIEEQAFHGCRRLTNINIPSALTEITYAAFSDCPFESITLPKGLKAIREYAFRQEYISNDPDVEPTVTELKIPGSVESIGVSAFSGLSSLEKVVFLGDAPEVVLEYYWDYPPFDWIPADFYYFEDKAGWTEDAMYSITGEGTGWYSEWHAMEFSVTAEIAEEDVETAPLICGSVYIGDSERQGWSIPLKVKPEGGCIPVNLHLTLPEGFSFKKDEIDTEESVLITGASSDEITVSIPKIYPIYISEQNETREHKIEIEITGIMGDGTDGVATTEAVFYCPSRVVRSVAAPIRCVNEAESIHVGYLFSLDSAAGSGTTYNKETARLCAIMAETAYFRERMEEFLVEQMGFSNFERQGIFIDSDLKLSVSGRYYASKQVIVDGKIKNLVYVVCRGTPKLPREWISNFNPGGEEMHRGFRIAAETIEDELSKYCEVNGFKEDNTIIVVTGHSRGAAVANLVGHWLNTSAKLAYKENISVYTFATPTVDRNILTEAAGRSGNENIFNWVNYQDAIRNSPSMQYYGRYGNTTIFAYSFSAAGSSVHDDGYYRYTLPNDGSNYTFNEIFNALMYMMDAPNFQDKQLFLYSFMKLARAYKTKYTAEASWLGELGAAHSMIHHYNAVVNDAPDTPFEIVNLRTRDAYNHFVKEYIMGGPDDGNKLLVNSYHCPIDLYVYDVNGNIAATIIDGVVTCNDETLKVYVEGESLNVCIFQDDLPNYIIQVKGYDNGTMKHCIQTVGADGLESVQIREDIPIVKDGILEVKGAGMIAVPGESEEDMLSAYAKYEDETEMDNVLDDLFPESPESEQFTISYDANGGENVPSIQIKMPGEGLQLSDQIPTRDGYTFLGWATKADAASAEYQPGSWYEADENLVLYALWEAVPEAPAGRIVVSDVTARPGETVEVTISLENNPGIISAQLDVYYDALVMDLVNVVDHGLLGKANHSDGLQIYPYHLAWENDRATANFTTNGTVVTLTFMVYDGRLHPVEKTAVFVGYTKNNFEIFDCDMNEVDFELVSGMVTIDAGCRHADTITVNAESPTCFNDGNKAYFMCKACGKYFWLSEINEVTPEEMAIPALGHDYVNGSCSRCCQLHPDSITQTNGLCGNSISWSFDKATGTLTISGMGEMWNYDYYYPFMDPQPGAWYTPWRNYGDNLKSVVIEGFVTSIGDHAFNGFQNLTSVTLPSSLTSIGQRAFGGCGFSSITLPENLATLKNGAFALCANLTEITIPGSVRSIGYDIFNSCSSLTSVIIQEGITKVGDGMFTWCNHLTNVSFPESLTTICDWAFGYCTALTSLTLPRNLREIGVNAFKGCSGLTSVTFPESLTSIGEEAFRYCTSLTGITFPESLTFLGECAFDGCIGLEEIRFLGNAPSISGSPFVEYYDDNVRVTEGVIYFPANNVTWTQKVLAAMDQFWVNPNATGSISDNGRTLSLSGVTFINQYVKVDGFEDVDIEKNGGLLIWNEPIRKKNALFGTEDIHVTGLIKGNGEYAQQTPGIVARAYADEMYLRVYIRENDGTYTYGPLVKYSVREYCEGRIEKSRNEKMRNTCAQLLHFGAAAQVNFEYNLTDLANRNIDPYWPRNVWVPTLLDAVVDPVTNISGTGTVTDNGKTLSLAGAIQVNFYVELDSTVGEPVTAELLFWDGVNGTLTLDNVTYKKDLIASGTEYAAQSNMFSAREYGKTIYACAHFVDDEGNDHYSDVMPYSVEEYAAGRIAKSSNANLVDAMKAMVTYGEAARVYFS